jgi:hypothetical protein
VSKVFLAVISALSASEFPRVVSPASLCCVEVIDASIIGNDKIPDAGIMVCSVG